MTSHNLKQQGDEGEWLPIETAPQDGTTLLLFKPDDNVTGSYIASGYWGEWSAMTYSTQCWIASFGGPLRGPTHWMPLPKPPHPHGSEG